MSIDTHSAEARWMFPLEGLELPVDVKEWFLAGKELEPESRSDEYLIYPNCETVGVKLRDGKKLEIKAQTVAPALFHVGVHTGKIDHWVKQSFEDPAQPDLKTSLFSGGQWRAVQKCRYLRKLSADGGKLNEVALEERPEKGCIIELTLIALEENQPVWYSLAFEAFGPPKEVRTILHDALQKMLGTKNTIPSASLTAFAAANYPTWLESLD